MLRWSLIVVAVLASGGILMYFLNPGQAQVAEKKEGSGFAADREPQLAKIAFNGERAMKYLKAVCDIGPRMSGTPGMAKQQELIRKHFQELGAKVTTQTFTAKQNSKPQPVEMTNLVVSFFPEKTRRVIFCSHYDTRPIADQEPDPRKWREPFVSANDGGSGVAFLMELSHHLKDLKPTVGVDLVFFDGEEYVFETPRDKYFFGSEYFAKAWRLDKKRPDYVGAILLDMIAGKTAHFPVEGHSYQRSRSLTLEVWRIASEVRATAFQDRLGERVMDDHLALQTAGIPAIDIIDFDYPHWHRLSDTPENCSAEPMEQVARVLVTWLGRQK